MLIYIKGTKSKAIQDRIRDSVKFYLSKLLTKNKRDKLTIYINVINKPVDDERYGYCDPLGKNPQNGRDEYEIECVHSPKADPIKGNVYKNLAHEMVHVKQFATGQMNRHIVTQKTSSGKRLTGTLWEGKIYSNAKFEDTDEGYYNSPWEIDAYGREVGLYRLWKQSRNEKEDL
jgi:hypothetical protein